MEGSMLRGKFRSAVSLVLCVLLVLVGPLQAIARAEFLTSEAVQETSSAGLEYSRSKVRSFLERGDVMAELQLLGVSQEEATLRVRAMSDAQISEISGALDQLPAGAGGLGTVVGALVFIFVLLLITDILGFTKVYPFTHAMH